MMKTIKKFLPSISPYLFLALIHCVLPGCALFGGSPLPDDPLEAEFEGLSPYQRAKQSGNVVYGMSMKEVQSVWGAPREVETAGTIQSGNQKWTYFGGLSAHKEVYFERGRVVGWKTR